MNSELHDTQEFHHRLLRLERQNLRVKRIGAAALVGAVSLLVMGQASPKQKTVEAGEFILTDTEGKTRASLSVDYTTKPPVSQLILFGPDGRETARIDSGGSVQGGGGVTLSGAEGQRAILSSTFLDLTGADRGGTLLLRDTLSIKDSEGYEATLGVSALQTPKTGERHRTSAASLVLFDKDSNVIWKAP